eukprot:g887.t1
MLANLARHSVRTQRNQMSRSFLRQQQQRRGFSGAHEQLGEDGKIWKEAAIGTAIGFVLAIAWKTFHQVPREAVIEEFYRDYDAQKKAGTFEASVAAQQRAARGGA